MNWYYHIAWFLIISQLFVLWMFRKNLRYALSNPWEKLVDYTPKTLLTIPCKGLDLKFDQNIESFIKQDYPDFIINFVVESQQDPAYARLVELKTKHENTTRATQINILVAGLTEGCSQKIHNMLCSYQNCVGDVKVLAFADSDVCVHNKWMHDIVCGLSQSKCGATTGYRWFVPEKNNLATVLLSICNGKIAQFLGKYPYNQAWGGSMAMLKERFEDYNVPQIWKNAISDDLALTYAVKANKKKIVFVPNCIVASYENYNIKQLAEFIRRQLTITRCYAPKIWLTGMISSFYSVVGFWGSLVLAIYALNNLTPHRFFYSLVPIVFILCHLAKSYFRSKIISGRLPDQKQKLKITTIADFVAGPFYSIILFAGFISSCFGNVINWRGNRYRLSGLNMYRKSQ